MAHARLRAELVGCDPRDTAALVAIAERFADTPGYADGLVRAAVAGDEQASIASTWLIKHLADAGHGLTGAQTGRLIGGLARVSAWEARLHLCQSVRAFDLSSASARALAKWLGSMLGHERPFLRAWSLDGLCRVAAANERHQREACEAIGDAEGDVAASVRARVRRLRKEHAYLSEG